MTKQKRNNIIKSIALSVALCFSLATVIKPESVQAQYIWTCYANSPTGNYFWRHPNISFARARAIQVCQANTPFGMYCVFVGCE